MAVGLCKLGVHKEDMITRWRLRLRTRCHFDDSTMLVSIGVLEEVSVEGSGKSQCAIRSLELNIRPCKLIGFHPMHSRDHRIGRGKIQSDLSETRQDAAQQDFHDSRSAFHEC